MQTYNYRLANLTATCQQCGKKLRAGQALRGRRYCSNTCSGAATAAGKGQGIQEPWSKAEEEQTDLVIKAGAKALYDGWRASLLARTPVDDSPEAERKVREEMGLVVVDEE